MNSELLENIPPDLIKFLLVVLFSLMIGLEQKKHYSKQEYENLFGTDRTFTLIGILGFILFIISPKNIYPFCIGGIVISFLLGIYYYQKMKVQTHYGLTSIITAIITYCLAPLIYTQPEWLVLLIVISILVVIEIKESLNKFTSKFDNSEFTTLAKFLVLAGVILPLLSDKPISTLINISPYHFWLAIVVVSGISYFSYLLRKFLFPDKGILFTGIIGGLYSSTATTIILARKSKETNDGGTIVASIFFAITMMYSRILVLAFLFKKEIALALLPYFAIMMATSAVIGIYFIKSKRVQDIRDGSNSPESIIQNPLEFKTAIIFGFLFVLFALVTGFVIKQYGEHGISLLSLIVGVTDIDPFIIGLFQGNWNITNSIITIAVLNAITSNNVVKFGYAFALSDKRLRKKLIVGFSILVLVGIIIVIV